MRFTVNTTVGIGGLFDPASAMGIEGQSTDFGETLYIWGIEEGPYMELPLVGPSTARHTTGRIADLFMNPLTYVLPTPEAYYGTASSLAWALDTRDDFSNTVDDLFDNSEDSYAQARILYLQNRRFKLGDTQEEEQSNAKRPALLPPSLNELECMIQEENILLLPPPLERASERTRSEASPSSSSSVVDAEEQPRVHRTKRKKRIVNL